MTAFNTALWISFPEKVSASRAELFMQNICKNEASPADDITSQNMNKLWWKMFAIFPMIIENLCLKNQYLLLSMDSQNAGQNDDWKSLCPPLKLIFFFCMFRKARQSCYACFLDDMFILLGSYLHTTVFCSRSIEINQKKCWFSIFLSKFSPSNLKVMACSCDSSSFLLDPIMQIFFVRGDGWFCYWAVKGFLTVVCSLINLYSLKKDTLL